MLKRLLFMLAAVLVSVATFAQNDVPMPATGELQKAPTPADVIPKPKSNITDLHQIYLDKAVEKINNIKYKEDGVPIEGYIHGDGTTIILKDYTKRGSILVDVQYKDGTSEEIRKSPCVIDHVAPL